MRILIAEDDAVSRKVLESYLKQWNYKVVTTTDGSEALARLTGDNSPHLAILDWMMPGLDGIDICRKLREREAAPFIYIIMLTARGNKEDVAAGFDAGADDYITKPFEKAELQHRIRAGERIVKLQLALESKLDDLHASLGRLRQLHDLLPICPVCSKVRTEAQLISKAKKYISSQPMESLTGSMCPDCRIACGAEYAGAEQASTNGKK
jgi:DNA-binding response OmpR family regulator